MSYSEDLGRAANKAFSSPSHLASRRFQSRLSPRSRSSDGDSHSVAASRRSTSMIQSEEDAEVFDQMNTATSVIFKTPSRRNRIVSSHSSVRSADDSTAGGGSQVEEFVRGVNETAHRLMLQLQVSASNSFTQPPVIPKLEARDIEQEDIEGSNWSTRDGEDLLGEGEVDDYGESRRSIRDQSDASSHRTPLELHHNDNTFHVLASLVVEFMEARLTPNGKTVVLQPEDKVRLARVLPDTIRMDFIDAVRYRLERAPEHAATPLDFVTLQCRELGLHREGRQNPVLVAAHLTSNAALVQLVVAEPLEHTHTLSFQSQPSVSFNPTPLYEEDEEVEGSSTDDEPAQAAPSDDGTDSGNSKEELPIEKPLDEKEAANSTSFPDEEDIEDVGGQHRFHKSMVSTMTTLDDGDKEEEHDEASVGRLSIDEKEKSTDNEETSAQVKENESHENSCGTTERLERAESSENSHPSSGNLTPLGVEMTFSEAESISRIHSLSRSKSSSASRSKSPNLDSAGQGESSIEREDSPSVGVSEAIAQQTREISITIPTFDSPVSVAAASSSASVESNVLSTVPPNTPAEFQPQPFHDRVLSDETTTLEETLSPFPDAFDSASRPSDGRPPLAPNTGTAATIDNDFRLQTENHPADSQTVASYVTGSITTESLSTVFNINPFSNLAALISPSSATESRSTLQGELEDKKDIASTTSQSTDYQTSDIVPDPPLDHEHLARKQLMAELCEARTLKEESENPEIAKFWDDHVTYLQFRLRALDGQEIYTSEEFAFEIAESNRRLIAEVAQREMYMTEDEVMNDAKLHCNSSEKEAPISTAVQEGDDKGLLGDEIIASRSSCSSHQTASGEPKNSPETHHFSQVDPPTVCPLDAKDGSPLKTSLSNHSVTGANHQGTEFGQVPEYVNPLRDFQDEYAAGLGTLQEPHYNLPMVDVVAPADLPGGYHFEAEIEGKRFLATVPQGGVQQGETFTCYMRDLDSVAIDIPVGYWRDNLSGLCDFGCCHPVIWNSFLCPLIALSQIQHRVGFDFLGRPVMKDGSSSNPEKLTNRTMMLIIISSWLLMNLGIYAGYNWKWSRGLDLTMEDIVALIMVNVAMYGFVVFATQSTRSSLREKFLIREQRCHDLEDIVLATTCLPCTVGQMSRHTANYDDYEAVCCSKTGLPDGVRVNQSRKEDGEYVV